MLSTGPYLDACLGPEKWKASREAGLMSRAEYFSILSPFKSAVTLTTMLAKG